MKIWKLVAGIVSIVLSAMVLFQSCAVGVADALQETESASGGGGMIVAIAMIVGGIISIVTRKENSKGPNIALIVVFTLAGIIGFASAGEFTDLNIWAAWCIVNAVIAGICVFKSKKSVQ